MIELTNFEGDRIGGKLQVMVSEIELVTEGRGSTAQIRLKSGNWLWVLEEPAIVRDKVNAWLQQPHG
jgi:hypothetical protein